MHSYQWQERERDHLQATCRALVLVGSIQQGRLTTQGKARQGRPPASHVPKTWMCGVVGKRRGEAASRRSYGGMATGMCREMLCCLSVPILPPLHKCLTLKGQYLRLGQARKEERKVPHSAHTTPFLSSTTLKKSHNGSIRRVRQHHWRGPIHLRKSKG